MSQSGGEGNPQYDHTFQILLVDLQNLIEIGDSKSSSNNLILSIQFGHNARLSVHCKTPNLHPSQHFRPLERFHIIANCLLEVCCIETAIGLCGIDFFGSMRCSLLGLLANLIICYVR